MNNSVNLDGYHLSFDAEMNSASDLLQFSNTFINGDVTIVGNSEAETYVPAATNPMIYAVANGSLTITATPTTNGGYTSGLLSTANSFSQNQGYFEIRAKLPTGAGFWSAFWLSAADYSAEVDITEQPNNDGAQNYFSSVKSAQYNAGSFENTGVDLSAGYHTYGFMWTASTVQFLFDGNYIGYAAPTPAAMATLKMFMIANLAVGDYGSWPGQPMTGATSAFSIDYIRAYSNDPAVPTVTTSVTTPTPTPPGPIVTPPGSPATSAPALTTDTLTVTVSQDALNGDAQYRILVDGYLQGDVYTASASHSSGQINSQTVTGNWGSGAHTVGILFLNPTATSTGLTRNLYIDSVSYDGTSVSSNTVEMSQSGFTNFNVAASSQTQSTLSLQFAETAAHGDSNFAVFIDGWQVTETQSVTASNAAGTSQSFNVTDPRLVSGNHVIAIQFQNPGSSDGSGRDLHLLGAKLNGVALSGSEWIKDFATAPTQYFGLTISS